MVRALLLAGADVNATNRAGQSALFIASNNGYEAMVELLLKNGVCY